MKSIFILFLCFIAIAGQALPFKASRWKINIDNNPKQLIVIHDQHNMPWPDEETWDKNILTSNKVLDAISLAQAKWQVAVENFYEDAHSDTLLEISKTYIGKYNQFLTEFTQEKVQDKKGYFTNL
jgi:hypothetical protein